MEYKSMYQKIRESLITILMGKNSSFEKRQQKLFTTSQSRPIESAEEDKRQEKNNRCIYENPISQKMHLKDKKYFLNIRSVKFPFLILKGPLMMKQYLLLTTAFLSLASLSYASDDQEENIKISSSSSQRQTDAQAEIDAIIKKYAPVNEYCTAFNGLHDQNKVTVGHYSYSFWVPGLSSQEDQEIREGFKKSLPSSKSVVTNFMRDLKVLASVEDIERGTVLITYEYTSSGVDKLTSWLKGAPQLDKYSFVVEADLEQSDRTRLRELRSLISSPRSSNFSSLNASSSSVSPDTGYNSEEEVQKLKIVIAKLTEENAQLNQSVTNATSGATPSSSFAPPPPPPPMLGDMPPPPPPLGLGSVKKTASKSKVVVLSQEYQPLYDSLKTESKEKISSWKQNRIEFYLKVLTEKGEKEATTFSELDDNQAQKVLIMPKYPLQLAYLSLSPEERKTKDDEDAAKAQKLAESSAKQGGMFAELLARKKTPIAPLEIEEGKREEAKTVDASIPSFAQVLKLEISDKEQLAFENAQKLWSGVSPTRKVQLLARFPNDIILKGILLKTISGEIVTLDSHKEKQYTAPTILKAGLSLLGQQKETSQEQHFTAEGIRDLAVYALLTAKAIGINAAQIKPVIEALRAQTF
ncbi:MAG: hypothetical protein J0H12_05295 [Candidatus Paracaedimonas acanthamoebae]|uniref:Uncharacterized protein n=1 Tax=Candidatus Paracaedimonas acanthamoebae TaxID=244581 RepID=A0A8J7PMK3_9PROT|nr:hypothetical protein [Candidatus Paracaedimonas acanthamoebae]